MNSEFLRTNIYIVPIENTIGSTENKHHILKYQHSTIDHI